MKRTVFIENETKHFNFYAYASPYKLPLSLRVTNCGRIPKASGASVPGKHFADTLAF